MKPIRIAFATAAALAAFSLPAHAQGRLALFLPDYGTNQNISATTTSASVTLTGQSLNDQQILLTNQGTGVVYCRAGTGVQTATVADMALVSGASIRVARIASNTVACVTLAGTATVSVMTGNNGY